MATLRTPQISGEVLATPEEITQAQESFEPRRATIGRQLSDRGRELEVIRKSDAELAEIEFLQKSGVKQAGVRATEDYVKDVERQQEEYRNKISANPLPTHKPTQEDLSTYAQIGSAMMTMGLMLGAGGKANAKLGMDAMTGMMNGWRKGRQDLWKQEAVNFEKAFNKIKADREAIYKNLQEGLKLASTNYAASKEKLETAAYIAGEGSVLKKRIENRDFKGIADFNESIRKTENNLNDNIRKAAGSLAQVRLQREFAQMQADAMVRAAKERRTGKVAAGGVAGEERQKPTADITNKFETTRDGLNSMTSVLEELGNPIVQKEWEKGSVELRRFLAERPSGGKEDTIFNQFLKQRAIQSLPAEVRKLIITIAAARNDYYKSISGTAVSGNEATRNFGAIIQPSDSLDQLKDKASQVAKKQVERINEYVNSYSFAPGLIRNAKTEIERARKYYEVTLPAGIPSGSRKIGKSPDGKDVYEAPDGEQYTPD